MKISASKKQLAKIISENGGWFDGANWASQDIDINMFSGGKPSYHSDCSEWASNADNGCCVGVIKGFARIPQWHQTILSRDEYFHLYPAPDADGWIEWKGGECPVERGTLVDVRHRNNEEYIGVPALGRWNYAWFRSGINPDDIIAYRLHKPGHTEQEYQDGIKPIDPAKQELTIEQLAADYRAKLAIAQRAQEEADSHRCGAEAALEKLVAAGKALGLVLSVSAPEPELVITDWRDLLPGDEVEYVNGGQLEDFGRIGVVDCTKFDESSPDMNVRLMFSGGHSGWPVEWRFIRRP